VYDSLYVRNAAGIDFSNTYGFGRANALRAVQMATNNYISQLGIYLESPEIPSASLNLAIPDHSSMGVTDQIHVPQNYLIESVQIKISTDHTQVGDLGVELTSPSGTTSKLLLINSNIQHAGLSDFTLLTNAFYGESSVGNWTIKVVDGATSDIGQFTSWKIKINGH
jgi:subtilisin-like proprotein convertase family protein